MSKRMRDIAELVDKTKNYQPEDALNLLKQCPPTKKLKQSVELAVMLGVNPTKSDQVVRGSTVLPHGTGRTVRVAVMAQGDKAELAKAAGADKVGFEDLVQEIQAQAKAGGKFDFDILIATPDAMRLIGPIGRVLGPRGLMPNPKVGTVTMDVAKAVQNAKSGQVSYRTDKNGIIHCALGKLDFDATQLSENMTAVLADLKKAKPSTSKGQYIKRIVVSSTMGPGVAVDINAVI